MNKIKERYRLSPNISSEKLYDAGFKYHKFRYDLHNELITLLITIEPESDWWTYQVLNADTNTLYIPYYNRLIGQKDLVRKLDRKINAIFRDLVAYGIFCKKDTKR